MSNLGNVAGGVGLGSIRTVKTWESDGLSRFLVVRPESKEVSLFRDTGRTETASFELLMKRTGLELINTFGSCSNKYGLIAIGQTKGNSLVLDLNNSDPPFVLPTRQARPCNTVAFNTQGLLATGLDKVRSDSSLNIWDVRSLSSSATPEIGQQHPIQTYLASETVTSATFFPNEPSTLAVGTQKFIREVDLRAPSPSIQVATKCVLGVTCDPFDDRYFAAHSADGAMCIWDRRFLKSLNTEPILTLNQNVKDRNRINQLVTFRYSSNHKGDLALLGKDGSIRFFQLVGLPPFKPISEIRGSSYDPYSADPQSSQQQQQQHPQAAPPPSQFADKGNMSMESAGTLRVTRDRKFNSLHDKAISFDFIENWADPPRTPLIWLTLGGQIIKEELDIFNPSLSFNPQNDIVFADHKIISFFSPSDYLHPAHKRPQHHVSGSIDGISENLLDSDISSSVAHNVSWQSPGMKNVDSSSIMMRRAQGGYELDCKKNLDILQSVPTVEDVRYLGDVWEWLDGAHEAAMANEMASGTVNCDYQGVAGIWEKLYSLRRSPQYEKNLAIAVSEIVRMRAKKTKIFTNFPSAEPGIRTSVGLSLRQLALVTCGWNFGLDQLDSRIKELEDKKMYEKAAAWAVFCGNIDRAVKILGRADSQSLRLTSTAIAGYFAYKDDQSNSVWKDQCRKMASELENPYMRAIFAYIADRDWKEVLLDDSLPIRDRLGIALRSLRDSDLSPYIKRMTERCVLKGELEGIILTGLTPRTVDLLQTYVDRTGDVQTAALIMSFVVPRYFEDKRVTSWIESYRLILDEWKFFTARAKFDVARARLLRDQGSNNGFSKPKEHKSQVFARCNHCNKNISRTSAGLGKPLKKTMTNADSQPLVTQMNVKGICCPWCKRPLPRCAICLHNLGYPIDNWSSRPSNSNNLSAEAIFDHWFNFCLTCSHGMHTNHAKEWFSRHEECPVSGCKCKCNMN